MTKHNKLMVLAAISAVISIVPITEAQAGRDRSNYPAYPASDTPSPVTSAFREWQDETILNNHLRQSAGLPTFAEKTAEAEARTSPAGESQLKQWQDETIRNNTMRQRMGLPPR